METIKEVLGRVDGLEQLILSKRREQTKLYGKYSGVDNAVIAGQVAEYEKETRRYYAEQVSLLFTLANIIQKLDDLYQQHVLRERYVHGKTWDEIAKDNPRYKKRNWQGICKQAEEEFNRLLAEYGVEELSDEAVNAEVLKIEAKYAKGGEDAVKTLTVNATPKPVEVKQEETAEVTQKVETVMDKATKETVPKVVSQGVGKLPSITDFIGKRIKIDSTKKQASKANTKTQVVKQPKEVKKSGVFNAKPAQDDTAKKANVKKHKAKRYIVWLSELLEDGGDLIEEVSSMMVVDMSDLVKLEKKVDTTLSGVDLDVVEGEPFGVALTGEDVVYALEVVFDGDEYVLLDVNRLKNKQEEEIVAEEDGYYDEVGYDVYHNEKGEMVIDNVVGDYVDDEPDFVPLDDALDEYDA